MATFYAPQSGIEGLKLVNWILEWMDDHLDETFHVLVEFKVPGESGRQVDFLVLTTEGSYCLEAKDKPYEEIRVNGCWLFRDRRTGDLVSDSHGSAENPYQQATNTADSFRKWISHPDNIEAVFGPIKDSARLKRDNYNRLEHFKVFPAVVIPKFQHPVTLEADNHCRLLRGPDELAKLTDTHWKKKFHISAEEASKLAYRLGLKAISVRRLLTKPGLPLPPDAWDYKRYCEGVLSEIIAREPLLESYVPNRLTAARFRDDQRQRLKPQTVDDLGSPFDPEIAFFITGEGGSGKTTCCLYLCWKAAKTKLVDPTGPFPVYLQLRDYRYENGGLRRLIIDTLNPLDFGSDRDLEVSLKTGKFIWCLDGLNESPDVENLVRELKWLMRQAQRSVFVLTSRALRIPEGSDALFDEYRLQPFSDEEIATYLEKTQFTEATGTTLADLPIKLRRSPLVLSLVIRIGHSVHFLSDGNVSDWYRELTRHVLERELAKHRMQEAFQLFWDDLCELAKNLTTSESGVQYEIPRKAAVESLWAGRLEVAKEKIDEILRILVASGLLREDFRRGTVSYIHPLIQSFFFATAIRMEMNLTTLLDVLTGHTDVTLVSGRWEDRWIWSRSDHYADSLKFLFGMLNKDLDRAEYDFMASCMFTRDPVLAAHCFDIFDREEFISRFRKALGFGDDEIDKGPYQFGSTARAEGLLINYLKASAADTFEVGPEEVSVHFDPQKSETIACDEIAMEIITKMHLQELAAEMLGYFCRTMQRGQYPYTKSPEGLCERGKQRFKQLVELLSPGDAAEVFLKICRSDRLRERHNAALVAGFLSLEEFHPANEDLLDQNDFDERLEPWYDTSDYQLLPATVGLCWHQTDLLSAVEIEGLLRALRILESVFLVQPLVQPRTNSLKRQTTDPEQGIESGQIDQLFESASQGPSWEDLELEVQQLQPVSERLDAVMRALERVMERFPELRTHPEKIASFHFMTLSRAINGLKRTLIGQMRDPLQSTEAAKAIVRLYVENLWLRKQSFWEKVSKTNEEWEGLSKKQALKYLGEVPEDIRFIQRVITRRDFEAFMEACSESPLEKGGQAAVDFLESELLLDHSSEEFNSAARLLLTYFREPTRFNQTSPL